MNKGSSPEVRDSLFVRAVAGVLGVSAILVWPVFAWALWPPRTLYIWFQLVAQPIIAWAFLLYAWGGSKALGKRFPSWTQPIKLRTGFADELMREIKRLKQQREADSSKPRQDH